MERNSYNDIHNILKLKIGLNSDKIESKEFNARILDFMTSQGYENIDDLVSMVNSNQSQLFSFAELLLDKKTWFYRDFNVLNQIMSFINTLNLKQSPEKIRILSLGCASGEEPYSIAMTLIEAEFNSNNFIIDGIDISATAIESAKQAVFNNNSFKDMDTQILEKYFQPAEELYLLHPKIAQLVNFFKVNFIEPNYFIGRKYYDIIVAKNIFKNLTAQAIEKLLKNITNVMSGSSIMITTDDETKYITINYFHQSDFSSLTFTKNTPDTQLNEEALKENKPKKSHSRLIPNFLRLHKQIDAKENTDTQDINQRNSFNHKFFEIKSLINSGQFDKAVSICSDMLKQDANNPEVYCYMGFIYEKMNDLEKAEDSYHKALYLEPNHYETLVKLIILFETNGWTDKAGLLRKRLDKISGKQ